MGIYKGAGLVAIRNWLQKSKPDIFNSLFNELTAEEMVVFRNTVSSSWISLDIASSVFDKIVKLMQMSAESGAAYLGEIIAEDNIKGIYRPLIRITQLSFIFKRTHYLWRRYQQRGFADIRYLDDHTVLFEVRDFPEMPLTFKYVTVGYTQRVMEIAGMKNAQVSLNKLKLDPIQWIIKFS